MKLTSTSSDAEGQSLEDTLLRLFSDSSERRIFALMGANGTGKTRFLKKLHARLHGAKIESRCVPSERSFSTIHRDVSSKIPDTIDINDALNEAWKHLFRSFSAISFAETPGTTISRYICRLIDSLHAFDLRRDARHEKAILDWFERTGDGSTEPRPAKDASLLEQLEMMIGEVLEYKCTIDMVNNHPVRSFGPTISFEKGASKFFYSDLSSGERSIFAIIVLLFLKKDSTLVIMIDEPEIHLNEAKAIDIWNRIEDNFPKASFFYATHNAGFAVKNSINTTYILGSDENVQSLNAGETIPTAFLRDLAGVQIQVLHSSLPVVFCEDALLLKVISSIFELGTIKPVLSPSLSNVRANIISQQHWQMVRSGGLPYCGIIDRDSRTDNDVIAMQSSGIFCFPKHESEAVLLEYHVLKHMLTHFGPDDAEISEDEYREIISECARVRIMQTLMSIKSYLIDRASLDLEFKYEDSQVICIKTLQPYNIEAEFAKRTAYVLQAIANKDAQTIIKTCDSKALYAELRGNLHRSKKFSLNKSAKDQYKSFIGIIGSQEILQGIDWLMDFKNDILKYLGKV